MKTISIRFTVNSRDIMLITGENIRSCQRLMCRIRKAFNLGKSRFISLEHFCAYTKLNEEKVKEFLK